jgi:alanine racemase
MRIATVGVGYADGLPRAAGNAAMAEIDGAPVPLVGRADVTTAPEDALRSVRTVTLR